MTTSLTNNGPSTSRLSRLVATMAIAAAASTASADLTDDVSSLFQANVTGGTWGFMLKAVDGPVLTAVNEDYLFYPASSIKVVQHLHAMKMVDEDNGIDLDTVVQVYTTQDDACDDDHTGQDFTEQTLGDTLRIMMENSGNANTNAIQEFFGRPAINATAHGVGGMSDDTELNHKFGGYCGGPQANQNQFPLSDASILYERVANGQVFGSDTRDDFYDLMLNWAGYFDDLLAQERPDFMSDEAFSDFRSGIRTCRKGGNWGSNIFSNMGWVSFPAPPCNDGTPRAFTFGTFVDFADSVDEDFGTQAVIFEMLREQVRELLEEWQACLACGTGGACDETHAEPGCDTGSCCEAVCAVDPYCCSTTWDQPCVGAAINLCGLADENDTCANAEPILGTIFGGTFDNAGSDGPSHLGCGWNGEFIKDLWFTYEANTDGHLEIQSLASFPTWVAVYDTDQCPVTANDLIACHEFPADAVDEVFETCAVDGQTYLIRVGALNTEQSSVTLHVHNKVGYANQELGENPNGIGVANEIIADDFELPCGDGGFDWLNIKVVDLDGDGVLPSSIQWFLYESNAVGTGPGIQIGTGVAIDMQVTPIEATGSAGAPDSFFDIFFELDGMPELFPDTTYWFGLQVPGLQPLAAEEQNGQSAQSLVLGSWQPAGGDFAFAIGQPTPAATCPADTNGDGTVGVDDLLNVIIDWGTATAPNNGDIDGNGTVDIEDLIAVILSWGDCP